MFIVEGRYLYEEPAIRLRNSMKLHLTSAYQVHPGLDTLIRFAPIDSVHTHTLCDDPESAEAIVFIENTQFDDVMFTRLRNHDLVSRFADKVFMYNEMDRPWNVLPGLYTCMTRKHMNEGNQRAFAYLSTPNKHVSSIYDANAERTWLYSFMGAMSHASRRQVMRLPNEQAFLKDTSDFNVWNTSPQELDQRAQDYANVLGSSKFVLCPRGIGTSSIRLYETLEAGRVPVIIADQWVPPEETDWSFAIQIRENRIKAIPSILKSHTDESIERGDAARNAWLANYSPDKLFNTFGNSIESLLLNKDQRDGRNTTLPWNKWVASGGLVARTTVQRIRGQR